MTCIVGLVADGRVLIGGDSAGSDGWAVRVRADSKVFRVGPYVLGFTTSFRMGQLLRYQLTVNPPDSWDVDRFMSTTFVDAVRKTLREGGWLKTDDGREQGGTFLVAAGDRLYTINSDLQIGLDDAGYAAVGSGYLVALGSLHTTQRHTTGLTAEEKVVAALDAAADIASGVRGPFTVLSTELAA